MGNWLNSVFIYYGIEKFIFGIDDIILKKEIIFDKYLFTIQ